MCQTYTKFRNSYIDSLFLICGFSQRVELKKLFEEEEKKSITVKSHERELKYRIFLVRRQRGLMMMTVKMMLQVMLMM